MAGSSSRDIQQAVATISDSDEDILNEKINKESRLLAGHKSGQQKCESQIMGLTAKLYVVQDRKKAKLEAAHVGCTPKASAATGAPAIPNPNLPVPTDANIPNNLAEGNVAKRSKSEATYSYWRWSGH